MRPLFALVAISLLSLPLLAQGPVVFINGDTGISGSGSGFALGKVGLSGSSISKHDETAQMARTLLKSCPEASLTVDPDAHADYTLLLSHNEGYGGASNQIMVLRPDKSVFFASNKNTVSRVTKESCKAVMADWKDKRPRVAREKTDPPPQWQAAQQ